MYLATWDKYFRVRLSTSIFITPVGPSNENDGQVICSRHARATTKESMNAVCIWKRVFATIWHPVLERSE